LTDDKLQVEQEEECNGDDKCIRILKPEIMREYNNMTDSCVLLTCHKLEKQLLSDKHAEENSKI
jgi:hypothetical protein